jgi:S-DNA-T family DNA segregation ATPase FtsK/SpoIIIE
MAGAIHQWRPDLGLIHLASSPSPLSDLPLWWASAVGVDEVTGLVAALSDRLALSDGASGVRTLVFIEDLNAFAGTPAEAPLTALFKYLGIGCLSVVAELETAVASVWSALTQPIKASRQGVVLQPDQPDGDQIFRTTFPRLVRRDFPAGRGMLVGKGRAAKVQVALLDAGG